MIRLGPCSIFRDEPIAFRRTTAAALAGLSKRERLARLPVSRATGVPMVYDVHHHRVLPDGLSVEEATRASLSTWRREPLFHVSSPINGWKGKDANRHHDFVRSSDVPGCWLSLHRSVTVEVEAKAKEVAVLRLKRALERLGVMVR